jgi:type I restriction enzyme S subunit
MEKLKNIPSLRFPEFEGNWEMKKLGEIAEKIGDGLHGTPIYSDDSDIYFINGNNLTNGKIQINENTKKVAKSTFEKNNKGLNKNTILISINGTIGNIAKYNNEKVMLGKSVGYYNFKESSDFYYHVLKSDLIQNFFISELTGSTIKNLSLRTLREAKIPLPNLPEQTKIASFLTAVDEKLTVLKQKKTLLEQYKKGVMQKIFSQELRFKDDNGNEYPDWEEKKLGEIFYSEKGKGISKNKVDPNGIFECILYGELYTKYNEVIYSVVSKTNEVDGIKSKVGDLLIPSSTTTTGIDLANITALNKNDVLLGGDITVLRSDNEINNVFYAYYLSNHKKEEIASYAQGSTIVHLYYSHIKDMEIHILSLSEQTKIANFLSAIDDKINNCQSQIEKTEVWKKGLLQQMFC